jgi:hypothetical protein
MHAHLTSLVDTHKYAMQQNRALGELIEEGVENQVAVVAAIAAVKGAAAFAAANPAIVAGVASIFKNVVWGGDVARKTVDPVAIDKSFDNSKVFAAEIQSRFPDSYNIITELRKALKQHHFDLATTIQDVSLLADTTASNADRTINKLALRSRLIERGSMAAKPMLDLKVWSYAIKRQVLDLETSITECDKIILILARLQKDVAKVQDALEAELDKIKNNLESSVKAQRAKMADLEQQLKSTGCVNNSAELLRAIFTLGIACAFDSPTKVKLENVRAALVEEETILKALLKRMGYFDGLVGVAKTLTEQAAGLLETTKRFRAALVE